MEKSYYDIPQHHKAQYQPNHHSRPAHEYLVSPIHNTGTYEIAIPFHFISINQHRQ